MEISYNAVLLRYHEIAIKGRNRRFFEGKLRDSVMRLLKDIPRIGVRIERGRMIAHAFEWRALTEEEIEIIKEQLPKCFGLETFSMCLCCEPKMEQIEQVIETVFPSIYEKYCAAADEDLIEGDEPRSVTYCMRARRSLKSFPMRSKELEIYFAEKLLQIFPRLKVNLSKAEINIGVEVRERFAFIYMESHRAPGGLPVSCSRSVLSLLSGGIDSPAACYMAMKRGCSVGYLTFHSHPYTPPASIEKVARLVQIINGFQKKQPLLCCNLATAQKAIRDNCRDRFRTILYRRMMMRIASIVAAWRGDGALLTGEQVGQVASQTIENMHVINRSTDKLIIRPLVGMDKIESINLARKIGTLAISEEEAPDSCTVFAPDSAATASKLHFIVRDETNLNIPELVRACIAEITSMDPETYEQYPVDSLQKFVNDLTDEQIYGENFVVKI